MMAAALFGAMTLGACVDNQESQSVTDIRDAKTEELKSQAALNNAQAEAAKVMANAEAALMAAEAEYQKALAEQVAAETELLEVEKQLAEVEVAIREAELEAALTELEAAKAELEATKADVQARIAASLANKARVEAQLEVDLARMEQTLLGYKIEILNQTKNLEAAQKINYIALFGDYNAAVINLNNAKSSLLNMQSRLEEFKLGVMSNEEWRAEQIEALNEGINSYNEQIAKYEAQIEAYNEFVTLPGDELEAKAKELTAKQETIAFEQELAWTAYQTWVEKQEVVDPFDTEFVNYVAGWRDSMYPESKQPYTNATYVGWNAPIISWENDAIGYFVEGVDPAYPEFIPMIENIGEMFKFTGKFGDYAELIEGVEEDQFAYYYNTYALQTSLNEEGFNKYLKAWAKALENCPEKADAEKAAKAYEEAEKAYNGEKGELAAYNKALEAYTKAKAADEAAIAKVEAAEKAVKDPANPTEAEENAIADAEKAQVKTAEDLVKAIEALDAARSANEAAIAKLTNAKAEAAQAAQWYAYNVQDYEAVCEEFEYLKELYAEAQAATEAYNANAIDSQVGELALDYIAALYAYNAVDAEIIALNEAYAADDNFEDQVALWEEAIEDLKAGIADAEEEIAEIEEGAISDEKAIAIQEAAIAREELLVAAHEKTVAEAKAKLDAALAE